MNQREAARDVPSERKAAYYVGMAMTVVGLLVFLSVFVTGLMHFGDFTDFSERARSEGLRAVFGMALMVVGSLVQRAGARGLAGSGVVLDPEQARRDLEPYSRMAGGMAADALDEAGVAPTGRTLEVVKLRCRACGKLNEDDSKFCQECGKAI